ncbi:MAG: glycosyltransferase [Candidatus Eisenbacteria bacterium]|nr:glycosyltransferase [Candidatus Eisenbacteria bacterium]
MTGTPTLDRYQALLGTQELDRLEALARQFRGHRLVMVNSTASGGGVAEILRGMMVLLGELGIDAAWEVMGGDAGFYRVTKAIHNGLHGRPAGLTAEMRETYRARMEIEAARLRLDGDVIMIHDPQPAGLVALRRRGGQAWIWRCHIDLSAPDPETWEFLEPWVALHAAAIFSAAAFVRPLPIPSFLAPPSIDPFADKNRELADGEMQNAIRSLGLEGERPILAQVSRFDRLKDPVGVVHAFARVKRRRDAVLVLAGGSADDDPEGVEVLEETRSAAGKVGDVRVLELPNDANVEINALQRASTVVFQKSLREGFALTVSEALWKRRATVVSAVGGIPLQVIHERTGLLVHSIEGAAFQALRLLERPGLRRRLGEAGREHVRLHFLQPRETRDYLAVGLTALAQQASGTLPHARSPLLLPSGRRAGGPA